ncbi:tenascin [Musca domestica]|uniref:Delta-like protein n=1 Tax=Musca domestica TaxID=7370 RepID=A0ABM3UXG3_MUSDO|nr:tenascin [Musca domestica]XP_058978224.1 tenascin [Musca domestica]XP_058978225.1 tenascin [Musca domestica]
MSPTKVLFLAILAVLLPIVQNYDTKYTKASIPLWKQRACEKAQKQKANSHYTCDDKGDVKCLPGWQGDLCQVPMCRKGCDPMNGYCQRPGECRCRIGYTGELCDKCIPLPGCQHGDCTKPFECICRPGWDGLFCTEPSCREGCHNTRGYCEAPNECRCRIGWAGRNCSDCAVLPGCQHGTCNKPLECNCLPGYTGLLCQLPICASDCHKQHGYCKKPGECRCKVGWTGPKCDQCFPYPGCVNGDCEKPWECNCKPGWGGILCDEALTYCKENPNICENGGKCISLTKEDGSYHCQCRQGYLGKNCEIIDEFLITSTVAPRITPPPPLDWETADIADDINENLIRRTNVTQNLAATRKPSVITPITKEGVTESHEKIPLKNRFNSTTPKPVVVITPSTPTAVPNLKLGNKFENLLNISGSDIIGTATTNMLNTKDSLKDSLKATKNSSNKTQNATTMSPLSRLEEEQHQPTFGVKNKETSLKAGSQQTKVETEEEEEEDDEECTEDDNDEDCEYEDDEEEEETDDEE